MSEFDPRAFVHSYLDDARRAKKPHELTRLDLKREWHKLGEEDGRLEFVKDIAALANLGHHAILVFGVDEKTFDINAQPIASSGRRDVSEIQAVISRHLTPSFSIDVMEMDYDVGAGPVCLSLVHVAPTRNRPHLVDEWRAKPKPGAPVGAGPKLHLNALFLRRGTTTVGPQSDPGESPTRTELDAMYFDRPETATRLKIAVWGRKQVRFAESRDPHIEQQVAGLELPVVFTNIGLIPTGVEHISVGGTLRFPDQQGIAPFTFPARMSRFSFWGESGEHYEYPIPIAVGRAEYARVRVAFFRSDWNGIASGRPARRELEAQLRVRDIFGNEFVESLVFEGDPSP